MPVLHHTEMEKTIPRANFLKIGKSEENLYHALVIAVEKLSLSQIETEAINRATPGNGLYQQWLGVEEIDRVVVNHNSSSVVLDWLNDLGIEVTSISRRKDYITANATIGQWNSVLATDFHEFHDHSYTGPLGRPKAFHRSESYSIPSHLQGHISAIFNTVQTPPPFQARYRRQNNKRKVTTDMTSYGPDGTVTIDTLNTYYNISNNQGDLNFSQSVFETSIEYFSTVDLQNFWRLMNIPTATLHNIHSIGAHNLSTQCPIDSQNVDCSEGNLDIQYLSSIAQGSTSIYWWVDDSTSTDPFLAWILAVADMTNPPLSNSLSWGTIENLESSAVMHAFNTEALLLAAQGVTILVSSGDNGAPNSAFTYDGEAVCLCNYDSGSSSVAWGGTAATNSNQWSGIGYFPSFPATSPYVTAVGATQGPESGQPETVCQSQNGGVITSGGGFSTLFPTPAWQQEVITEYLSYNSPKQSGYNMHGRGYPDIALLGYNYQIVVNDYVFGVYGSSCGAPVLSAMITLVNTMRKEQGKGPVGFLNPTLYAVGYNNTRGLYGPHNSVFRDVDRGHNRCCADQGNGAQCCQSGFEATCGWDPASGWGGVTLPNLMAMFNSSSSPTSNTSSASAGRSAHMLKVCKETPPPVPPPPHPHARVVLAIVVAVLLAVGMLIYLLYRWIMYRKAAVDQQAQLRNGEGMTYFFTQPSPVADTQQDGVEMQQQRSSNGVTMTTAHNPMVLQQGAVSADRI